VATSAAPAARHAMRILTLLASRPGPVSASEIAGHLGLPRSTAYHLLTVMHEEGFVAHLPEERLWGLGIAAFEAGSAYLRHDPLERLASPLVARLSQRLDLTAHLGVLDRAETLYLLKQQPRFSAALVTAPGVRLPAFLTASGRAILAGLPAAHVRSLLPGSGSFARRTGHGVSSLSGLRAVLSAERAQGFAHEHQEVSLGFESFAIAATDHTGRPVAALSVTRPIDAEHVDQAAIIHELTRATRELTTRMGGAVASRP